MCLYTAPEIFKVGIAGAGPTEWENYNSWYSQGTIGTTGVGTADLKKYSLLPLAKNLKGLKIERGVLRRLSKLLGRSSGCTHIYELSVEAVRLSSNVLLGFEVGDEEWRERKLNDEEFIERAKGFLADSCLPFKTDDADQR